MLKAVVLLHSICPLFQGTSTYLYQHILKPYKVQNVQLVQVMKTEKITSHQMQLFVKITKKKLNKTKICNGVCCVCQGDDPKDGISMLKQNKQNKSYSHFTQLKHKKRGITFAGHTDPIPSITNKCCCSQKRQKSCFMLQ